MIKEDYESLINEALLVDDENEFIQSCADFFDERGFLSKKQVEAIEDFIMMASMDATTQDIY